MKSPESRGIFRRSALAVASVGVLTLGACAENKTAVERVNAAEEQATKAAEARLDALKDANKECGRLALDAAREKFPKQENDPATPNDEAYDADQAAAAGAEPFMLDKITGCMHGSFTDEQLAGFPIENVPFSRADGTAVTIAPTTTVAG